MSDISHRTVRMTGRDVRQRHRAATPLTWLTASVAALAALGSLLALGAGTAEWAVLAVLAAVVLVVGLVLATWRAHASMHGEATS